MKIFFLYILFLSLTNLKAQIPLPEFNDKPAYFEQNKKQLVELEKSQYNTMAKAKGLFSAEAGFFLEGATSKVLIPRQTELKFIVKVVPGTDASAIFDLAQFEIRKDKRVFIASQAKIGSSSTSYQKIDFELVKIKEGFYYLVAKNLTAGQYFFGSKDAMFAFSVY